MIMVLPGAHVAASIAAVSFRVGMSGSGPIQDLSSIGLNVRYSLRVRQKPPFRCRPQNCQSATRRIAAIPPVASTHQKRTPLPFRPQLRGPIKWRENPRLEGNLICETSPMALVSVSGKTLALAFQSPTNLSCLACADGVLRRPDMKRLRSVISFGGVHCMCGGEQKR
jgi:hypothetical protein